MKITTLYVYPIKALRGIQLTEARVNPQGIEHDRCFMLCEVRSESDTGHVQLKKMQLSSYPQCALFEQQISRPGEAIAEVVVRYCGEGDAGDTLAVPLEPDISALERVEVDLHGSPATSYRMGGPYDAWFSARFGFPTTLVYIGDGRRAVLGTSLLPPTGTPHQQPQQRGWISSITTYVTGTQPQPPQPWLTFTDVAPFLVTSEASLRQVNTRLPEDQPVGMFKFRPNIVVDGEGEGEWAEDFWAELVVTASASEESYKLLLTGNCGRCTSLNVDYQTGKPAAGELGSVLKKLMKDRRVDPGIKWSPVFGRYASLSGGGEEFVSITVGDAVEVTRRNDNRSVWDWPGL